MTTLQYTSNETRRFKSFVSNRIGGIRDHSKSTEWRYVPTHLNPAADLTRGLRVAEITLNHRYLAGRSFIRQSNSTWPSIVRLGDLLPDDVEVKADSLPPASMSACEVKLTETDGLLSLPARTSRHLLRVTAWIRRFVNNCRAAAAGSSSDRRTRSFGPLTPSETDEALLMWIAIAQRDGFST